MSEEDMRREEMDSTVMDAVLILEVFFRQGFRDRGVLIALKLLYRFLGTSIAEEAGNDYGDGPILTYPDGSLIIAI